MNHIIVETIEGFESFVSKNRLYMTDKYYSSNQKIINHIKSSGKKAEHIETLIKTKNLNILGKFAYNIEIKITNLINKYFKIFDNLDIGNTFNFSIYQSLFILLYKQTLLNNLKKKISSKCNIICVGSKNINKHSSMDLYFDRFDNIFSILTDNNKFINFHHQVNKDSIDLKRANAENIPISHLEKFFSLFDNSFSSFCFKIFNKLPLTNLIYKKNFIYIYGYNETVADMYLDIIKKKYNIKFIPKPHKQFINDYIEVDISTNEKYKFLKNQIKEIFDNDVSKKYLDENFSNSIELFINRVLNLLYNIERKKVEIKNYYQKLISNIKPGSIVLSNGFYQTEDKFLFFFLKQIKLKIISFDHGWGIGMDKIRNDYLDRYSGVMGDVCGLSSELAEKSLKKFNPIIKKYITGNSNRFNDFFSFKKILLKIVYKISLFKNIIFIVVGTQNNNSFRSPYTVTDRRKIKKIKTLIKILCKEKKNSQIILKLYPGARYFNEYNFEELKSIENLKIIRKRDFRWLRYMADSIVTTVNDSTLGQICETKVNGFFLNYYNYHQEFDYAQNQQAFFKNCQSVKLIDKKKIYTEQNLKLILREI